MITVKINPTKRLTLSDVKHFLESDKKVYKNKDAKTPLECLVLLDKTGLVSFQERHHAAEPAGKSQSEN